jgi:hypothetical protein
MGGRPRPPSKGQRVPQEHGGHGDADRNAVHTMEWERAFGLFRLLI